MPGTLDRQDTITPPLRRTAAGDAFSRFAVQVLRLAGELGAAGDTLSSAAGQTSARWRVLAAIEEESMTVADVGRMLALTRQSVQRIADALAADRLVAYVGNPRHRRAKLVELTPAGREALYAIQVAQCDWANALGERVGAEELARTSDVLAWALTTLAEDEPVVE